MTFTRLSDDATLTPVMVYGPYETAREIRNISRELLHSSATRSTYVPPAARSGEYKLLFNTHGDAKDALAFFSDWSLYLFEPAATLPEGWGWVDGYYVYEGGDTPDDSFNATFIVLGDELHITQDDDVHKWHLTVPYKEASE